MSGVDRADQMLSYHSALRKTIRWYKKVGIHIIEMTLSNAYYMYANATPYRRVKNMQCFREMVIDKRKESRYQCLKCEKEPALCIDPCFRLYQVKLGIAPSNTDESNNESDFD